MLMNRPTTRRTTRTMLTAVAALVTTGALLTGAAHAADWRPRPVPDSQASGSPVTGVAADGVRTLIYADGGTLTSVTSRKAGWRAPVPITALTGTMSNLTSSIAASGTVTVAWSTRSGDEETAWLAQRIGGFWGAPIELISGFAVSSISVLDHPSGTFVSVSRTISPTGPLTRDLDVWRIANGSTVALAPPRDVNQPSAATLFASGEYAGLAWADDPLGKALVAFLDPDTDTWGPTTQVNSGNNAIFGRPVTAAGGVEAAPDGTTAVITWVQDGRDDWFARAIRGRELAAETLPLFNGPDGTSFESTFAAWDGERQVAFLAAYDRSGEERLLGATFGGGTQEPAATVHSGRVFGDPSLAVSGRGATVAWMDGTTIRVTTRTWLKQDGAWQLQRPSTLGEGATAPTAISDSTPAVAWIDSTTRVQLSLDLQGPRLKRVRAASGGQVRVSWAAPPQMAATTYVVQIRPRGGRWVTVDRVRTLRASFRGTAGTTYDVRVRAIAPKTASLWSPTKRVTARG